MALRVAPLPRGDEPPSPTLAPENLWTHTPVLVWEGSILQVPPPHASFNVGNLLLVEEKAQLLSQHPHGLLAKLVRCQGTMWAPARIAGGNGASAVPKAIAIPIALTS